MNTKTTKHAMAGLLLALIAATTTPMSACALADDESEATGALDVTVVEAERVDTGMQTEPPKTKPSAKAATNTSTQTSSIANIEQPTEASQPTRMPSTGDTRLATIAGALVTSAAASLTIACGAIVKLKAE